MKGNGELASSDIEKAEVLNKCFDSLIAGGQAPPHVHEDPDAPGERDRILSHCNSGTSLRPLHETECM